MDEKPKNYTSGTVPNSQVLARYVTSFVRLGNLRAYLLKEWHSMFHPNHAVTIHRNDEGGGVKFKIYYNIKRKKKS